MSEDEFYYSGPVSASNDEEIPENPLSLLDLLALRARSQPVVFVMSFFEEVTESTPSEQKTRIAGGVVLYPKSSETLTPDAVTQAWLFSEYEAWESGFNPVQYALRTLSYTREFPTLEELARYVSEREEPGRVISVVLRRSGQLRK